jgi:NAD(P)-dependent dehydrogenase (short-subunit alcohol dehydrogenase family)
MNAEKGAQQLRFDGQVAIVTGAGSNPGLGRAHARLLAARGAKVVVNDLGVGPDGSGAIRSNAQAVVDEIRAAGGEAIADHHSVADENDAKAVVQAALDTWGRVDVLVNNAGIGVVADFDEISSNDIGRLMNVHLMGHLWMSRAAWPHMKRAGYGRIVNTTSGAMFGMDGLTVYGAAKFGIYGLTRGLANEGARYNIKCNALSPGAATVSGPRFFQMEAEMEKAYNAKFTPERVSPAIVYLAHESCAVTGSLFEAGGGHVSARVICRTEGITHDELTIEDVSAGINDMFDETNLTVVTNPRSKSQLEGENVASLLKRLPYRPT